MAKKEDYGSAYLYAEDLLKGGQFRTVTAKIAEVIPAGTLTAANGKRVDKPTLRFDGKDKLLVLCKTNQAMIVFCTGDCLENAAGSTVTIEPRIVEAFGDQVVALRIVPPPGVKVRRSVLQRLGKKAIWEGVKKAEEQQATEGGE